MILLMTENEGQCLVPYLEQFQKLGGWLKDLSTRRLLIVQTTGLPSLSESGHIATSGRERMWQPGLHEHVAIQEDHRVHVVPMSETQRWSVGRPIGDSGLAGKKRTTVA